MKLPGGVLAQAALVSQLLAEVEHTSTDVMEGNNCTIDNYELLTRTRDTISSVSLVTGAGEATRYM